MEVYQPAEDSYMFAEFLEDYFEDNKDVSYLDMGCGSGILGKKALDCGVKEVLSVDINPEAVEEAGKKGIKAIASDLFENVSGGFDVISFNAPYLPLDEREPEGSRLATTGGEKGDEAAVRFLEEAKKHLAKNGRIFLLISSLTPMDKIKEFGGKVVVRKRIFGEDLIVLEYNNA
ncbi:protoporphyrinogen oxidase [Candidatus Pacearchaeota archaeon]|nr:protoporphyrinogen oxidase [Candidatus Pacearchaeota archaeon]|tara:strand:+ start:700 stop:1224 length:525 start_codon:yes stop_codon:yes gene_type:complete